MSRFACRCLCLVALLCCPISRAFAFDRFTATASFYDGVNLTTGMSEVDPTVLTLIIGSAQEVERIAAPEIDPLFHFSPSVTLSFGFTTDPAQPILLQPQAGVSFAVLEQTDPASLTEAQLAMLDYAAQPVAVAPHQLVVANLGDGVYRLLGQMAATPDATVQFTVWTPESGSEPTVTPTPPVSVPEPGSIGLVILGGVLLSGWRWWKTRLSTGGKFMKSTYLIVLIVLLLSGISISGRAAELKVIIIGPGNGEVIGEGIDCNPFCTASYPEKTVVQLKAVPDANSTFEGWYLNGEPSQGTITIDQEDILVAAKFSTTVPLEENRVMWYADYRRWYATLALDEVIVFPGFPVDPKESSAIDYEAFVRELAQTFHPKATFADGYLIRLKSPEMFTREQLTERMAELRRFKYVRQVSPVLYYDPVFGDSALSILTGEIIVRFPKTYTSDQIQAIEQEYGLTRIQKERPDPLSLYYYRVDGDALHALMVANELYESGLVEDAVPDSLEETLLNQVGPPSNTDAKVDQWHLREGIGIGNMEAIWQSYQGSGKVIAVLDDGIDYLHEALQPNLRLQESYNFFDRRYGFGKDPESQAYQYYLSHVCPPSPDALECRILETAHLTELVDYPYSIFGDVLDQGDMLDGSHGTAVAGLAAARGGNAFGIRGVAPQAQLVGYRLNGIAINTNEERLEITSVEDFRSALIENPNNGKISNIDVYNSSIGFKPFTNPKFISEILNKGASAGKIYVFSAGNDLQSKGLNTNYSGLTKHRFPIVVGAFKSNGDPFEYSIPGANVLISVPVARLDIMSDTPIECLSTTDGIGDEGYNTHSGSTLGPKDYANMNYTKYFTGTSAAAPVVTGAVALLLQASPEKLSWRDVQQILIYSAKKVSPSHPSWMQDHGLLPYSAQLGFGGIDVDKAIEMAKTWKPLGELQTTDGILKYARIDVMNVKKNLSVETVEVMLTVPDYVTVTLISPIEAESPLIIQPIPAKLDEWNFTSMRHVGESSQGEWRLEVRDKNGKLLETGYSWKLKIYGTELAPYVKAVNAFLAPEQPAYHAGWTLADGQLTWAAFTPPSALPPDAPFTVQVTASQPMNTMSIAIAGTTYPLAVVADTNDTIWEAQVTLPDTPGEQEYGLTITGVDANAVPLLAFADQTPKAYPPVDAVPSAAGDTAHRLTTISAYGWTMTMPDAGTCEESGGGVVCAFGTPKSNGSTAHYGRMALLPQEADPPSVTLMAFASNGTTHRGRHLLSGGLRLEVQPNAEWFGDCAEESAEARCPDSADCQGEEANNPQCRLPDPQEQSETKSLPYQIAAQENRERDTCQVTVTYTLPDGSAKHAVLTIQPARLCRSVADRTGVQEAQAICGWAPVKVTNPYAIHDAGTRLWSLDTVIDSEMALCNEWEELHWFFSLMMTGFECQQNPEWKQCPAPRTTPVIPFGQPGWTSEQVIGTAVACHGAWREFVHIFKDDNDSRCCFFSSFVHLDGKVLPRKSASVPATITYTLQQYEIVAQCEYQRMTQRIEPPAGGMGLDVILPLRDSAAAE